VSPWKRRLAIAGILSVVLGTAAFVLLRLRGLAPGYVELRTLTDDASGLMDGTQVRLNGIPIGYLDGQKLTNSLDPARKVELDLRVRSSELALIPDDSTAGLASDNLLGEQYIAIRRGKSAQHIVAGGELRAAEPQDISKMMARLGQEMDRVQAIAIRADKLIEGALKGNGSLAKMVNDPNLKKEASLPELSAVMDDIRHGHGTLTKLFYEDPLSAQMQSPKQRWDDLMATVNHRSDEMKQLSTELDSVKRDFKGLQAELTSGKGSAAHLHDLQQRIDGLMVKWNAMMDRMTAGPGTLGQLLINPQLSEALSAAQRDFQELSNGLSTNPRKYVTLKIF
jgi:phospholipid/cholesterol/gamma-HCH transport system substrate-binding protein